MTLTRAELELVSEEIDQLVGRAVIQRVLEVDDATRIFRMRVPGESHLLLVSLAPDLTRAHLVSDKPAQPPRPTAFTMLLRKWVEGAHLEGVEMLNDDRILRLDLDVADPEFDYDSGEKPPRRAIALVAELFGRNPNLYLVDEDRRTLGQQYAESLGDRTLGPGHVGVSSP